MCLLFIAHIVTHIQHTYIVTQLDTRNIQAMHAYQNPTRFESRSVVLQTSARAPHNACVVAGRTPQYVRNTYT